MTRHDPTAQGVSSRHRLILWAGGAGGAVLALALLWALCGPFLAGAAFRAALARSGFPDVRFERAFVGASEARFDKVALDSESFSTIETIAATYGLWDLIVHGRLKTLRLSNAVLTGEWEPGTGPRLAGWSGDTQERELSSQGALDALPVESVTLENIRVDMATTEGGITLQGNGSLSRTPDGGAAFQAAVEGKQYQLSLQTALSGKRAPDGTWSVEANIQNGRLNLDSCRLSRIDGWLSATGGPGVPQPTLSGQLTAGKFVAGWLQMQSLSASVDGTPDSPHVILNAAAAGVPGLGVAAELRDGALVATLSAQRPSDLRDYLVLAAKSLGRAPPPERAIPKGFSALTLTARREAAPADQPTVRRYSLSLEDAAKTLSIRSDLMRDGATLVGTLETGPVALETIGALFPGFLPGGWRVAGGTTRTQGQIAASWGAQGLRIDGPLKVELRDVDLDSDAAQIEGANATLVFDSLTPPVTTGLQTLAIKRADIGLPIDDVSARIRLEPGGVVAVQSMTGGFAGGRIDSGPFRIREGGFENAQVRLTDVDLTRAVKAFRSRDLSLSGVVDGQMTVSKKAGGSILARGKIETRKPGGTVRYTPDPVPAFLAGDDPGLTTARRALENLHYEVLAVDFQGPLDGDMETRLTARGFNDAAFGDRPVELNLNLQGAILPLFKLAR